MKRFKLVTLLGIRPDIIRMHKLIKLLDAGQKKYGYEHVLAHTGQHFDYELDGVFYKQLNVRRPTINLNVGRTLKERGGPVTHAYQTALLFERTEEFIQKEMPDAVMYLGDTNSVVSSFIVARNNIPVIHIEGGGRSFDWRMPEEKCRTVIDHLSDVIYCYLPRYREILLREGIAPFRIKAVGNIIVDAIDSFLPKADKNPIMKMLEIKKEKFILVTLHREENTISKAILTEKITDLMRLTKKLKMPVVFPIMPRVKKLLGEFGLQSAMDKANIIQTKPLGFFEFLNLEKNAKLIVSDSGTVQEEALILGTPCLTSRLSTERPETMEAGATILSNERLYENALQALELPKNWDRNVLNPTGTSPSEVIFEDLVKKIQNGFFQKSRLFEMTGKDHFVQQAYGKT
ncbi:MAG TPA: UDP-N-acetylglucosamine 2-epimerase (non-hydrolyzing) [Patescibacteria group bacterium]|nr:UDP-N-acetylglucosamine 2-epimerase (non-hydrolyzing) [Patescibacteria group bacterium]